MATRNRPLANQHQASYRQRRNLALQPIAKPWDWLTLAEVQKLAAEAYRAASYALANPEDQPADPRGFFVSELAQAFEVLAAGAAQDIGIACAPANAKHFAACLRQDVPRDWRPQYPVYQKKAPASVCTTPEAVTNADEGNVNDSDLTR